MINWVPRIAALMITGMLGFVGWHWLGAVPVRSVEVRGFVHADSTELVGLAGIDRGGPIMDVSAALVADRVRRHPWVKAASASRNPTGTLVITVRERVPVSLYLDGEGVPAYYMDSEGFRMPFAKDVVAHVPVFRGVREPYHPVSPVKSAALLQLLALLPELPREQDALVSEVHEKANGEIELFTAITPAGQSVRVLLGRDQFAEKIDRLQAFWIQSVLRRPTTTYEWIDLRFDGQIVSRERA